MTTRAQLQEKSIAELREIAAAAGIETDGLQKSRLISRILEIQAGRAEAPGDVAVPAAAPRSADNASDKASEPASGEEAPGDGGESTEEKAATETGQEP